MSASRHVLIVTPSAATSLTGNSVTAGRWARLLRQLGHRVTVTSAYDGQAADLLIALHAIKSANHVRRFLRRRPSSPVLVTLAGTDIYGAGLGGKKARATIAAACRLIVLQPDAMTYIPVDLRARTRVIRQSAVAPLNPWPRLTRSFEICVSGHLRPVKDPFRAALAARRLSPESRIRISHLGKALSAAMHRRAHREMTVNARYRWLGAQPRWRALRILQRSRAVVITSHSEGGANVVSEALACGVPVLATGISGNYGLLGDDYEGYFPVGQTRELTELLWRFEQDASFRRCLINNCKRRAALVTPGRELRSWEALLNDIGFS